MFKNTLVLLILAPFLILNGAAQTNLIQSGVNSWKALTNTVLNARNSLIISTNLNSADPYSQKFIYTLIQAKKRSSSLKINLFLQKQHSQLSENLINELTNHNINLNFIDYKDSHYEGLNILPKRVSHLLGQIRKNTLTKKWPSIVIADQMTAFLSSLSITKNSLQAVNNTNIDFISQDKQIIQGLIQKTKLQINNSSIYKVTPKKAHLTHTNNPIMTIQPYQSKLPHIQSSLYLNERSSFIQKGQATLKLIHTIRDAQKELIIATPELAYDPQIKQELLNAQKRGVMISIITNGPCTNQDTLMTAISKSNWKSLSKDQENAIEIYLTTKEKEISQSYILVDQKLALLGDADFTKQSLRKGHSYFLSFEESKVVKVLRSNLVQIAADYTKLLQTKSASTQFIEKGYNYHFETKCSDKFKQIADYQLISNLLSESL